MSQFTFPFSNFWGMVVTSGQSPQSSWQENLARELAPTDGLLPTGDLLPTHGPH